MLIIYTSKYAVMQSYTSHLEERGIHFKFTKIEKIEDLQKVQQLIDEDNIIIINIVPILRKSLDQTEYAIQELHSHCIKKGLSLARMGQGRVLILPSYVIF